MTTDHPAIEVLQGDDLASDVAAHVAGCPRCRIDRRMLRQPIDAGALDDTARMVLAQARAVGATTVDERWEATAHEAAAESPRVEGLMPAGTRVERYEVEALLGSGGMAVVYRVRHTRLNSLHALKVLTLASPAITRRLLQEGQAQSSLRHPNVVAVTDVVEVDGAPGLVMEYVDGPTLAQLARGPRIDLASADRLAIQIIHGVAAVHDAGLVHRDLKPGNVLIDTSGGALTAKVADFGIAKLSEGSVGLTGTRVALGTPSYMAPEQILDSKRVDERADVFALGACLYELVTGQRAFLGTSSMAVFNRIVAGRYVPPEALVSDLPERMARAIAACLQVDRDDRVASARELLDLWTARRPPAPSTEPWDPRLVARARALTPEIALAPTGTRTWLSLVGMVRPASVLVAAAVFATVSLLAGFAGGWFAHDAASETRTPAPVVSDRAYVQRQFEMGWEQLMTADLDGARRSFAVVIDREPAEPYPVVLMAFTHDLAGDLGSAYTLLDRKRHLEDGNRAGADLLRLYHRDVYPGPENRGWEEARAAHQGEFLYSLLAARVWRRSHESRKRLFEEALEQEPQAYAAYLAYAEARHEAGDWPEEKRALELVLAEGAVPAQAIARLMVHYLDAGTVPRSFAHGDLSKPSFTPLPMPELTLRRWAMGLKGAERPAWGEAVAAVDRVRLLREYAALELGFGRWSRARELSRECVAVAEGAALWSDALLCAESWVQLALVQGDPAAVAEAADVYTDLAVLPELPREQGVRARGLAVYLEGYKAWAEGDLQRVGQVLKRLAGLGTERCGWTTCKRFEDNLLAMQHPNEAPATWLAGDCMFRLLGARLAEGGLEGGYLAGVMPYRALVEEKDDVDDSGRVPCAHAGIGRFVRAESHIRLARSRAGTDDADTHLREFRRLWPEPDPDHPLVLEARQLTEGEP